MGRPMDRRGATSLSCLKLADDTAPGTHALDGLLSVLDEEAPGGAGAHFLQAAGLTRSQCDRAALGQVLTAMGREWPRRTPFIAAEAGLRTASDLLPGCLDGRLRLLLRTLPRWLSTPVLARMVCAGMGTGDLGRARVVRLWPVVLQLDTPFASTDAGASVALSRWYAALFETFFDALIDPGYRCAALPGQAAPRFTLYRD